MDSEPPIPPLPPAIKEAIRSNRFVIFAGSGLSQLMGYPMWRKLANLLLKDSYKDENIEFDAYRQLNNKESDPAILLSIVYGQYEDKKQFNKRLLAHFKIKKSAKNNPLIKAIVSQGISIVTTNYDMVIENNASYYNSYSSCFDNRINTPQTPYVFHIHGSPEDKKHLVVTMAQYDDLYQKQSEDVNRALRNTLGRAAAVLFLGYGLNEKEIIRFIRQDDARPDKYYILKGFYSEEEPIIESYREYYRSLQVTMIPFKLQDREYQFQEDIITGWIEEIENTTNLVPNTLDEIREICEQGASEKNVSRIIPLIAKEDYAISFFRRIYASEDLFEWMLRLTSNPKMNDFWNSLGNKEVLFSLVSGLLSRCKFQHPDNDAVRTIADRIQLNAIEKIIDRGISEDYFVDSSVVQIGIDFEGENRRKFIEYLDILNQTEDDINVMATIVTELLRYCQFRSNNINDTCWLSSYLIKTYCSNGFLLANQYLLDLNTAVISRYDADQLATIFQAVVLVIKDKPHIFDDVGSVDEALDTSNVVEIGLLSITESCIGKMKITDLEGFVEDHVASWNGALGLIALHIVNRHFNELKQHLLSLENFDGQNYSELYCLIRKNVRYCSDEEIHIIQGMIEKSSFDMIEDYADVYRCDLMKLIPNRDTESPCRSRIPDNDPYLLPIADRGKKRWIRSYKPPAELYPDLEQFKESIQVPGKNTWQATAGLMNLLSSDRSVIENRFDELLELPPEYYGGVAQVLQGMPGPVLSQFDLLFHKLIEIAPEYISQSIWWLKKRSDEHQSEREGFTKLLMELVGVAIPKANMSEMRELKEGLFNSLLRSWFNLLLYILIAHGRTIRGCDLQSDFNRLIDRILKETSPKKRCEIYELMSMFYDHMKQLDVDMDGRMLDDALLSEQGPVIALLYISNGCSVEAIEKMYSSGVNELIFRNETLDALEEDNTAWMCANNLVIMYLQGEDKCMPFIRTIAQKWPEKYLGSVLLLLSKNPELMKDVQRTSFVLGTAIEAAKKDDDPFLQIGYFDVIMKHDKTGLSMKLFIEIIGKINYISEKIIDYLLSGPFSTRQLLEIAKIVTESGQCLGSSFEKIIGRLRKAVEDNNEDVDPGEYNRILICLMKKDDETYRKYYYET